MTRSLKTSLLAGASRRRRAVRRPRLRIRRYDPPQRLLRPDPRALQGVQRGLRRELEGRDRRDRHHPAVAWRLGQAGPRGDRRPRRRRRDAGARRRHRRDRREVRQDRRRTGGRACRNNCVALHLDHRVPGAQGQPQGHQGLGRPGQGRRRGDHAEPEDLGRRALELPRGLGLGRRRSSAATRPRSSEFVAELYQPRAGARHRRARLDHDLRRSASIGDVLLAWENEAFLALDEFGADKFEIVVPADLDPRRAAGGARRRQCRRQGHAQGRRGLSRTTSTRDEGQTIAAKHYYRPSKPDAVPTRRTSQRFPKIKLVTIDDPIFGGWAKAQPKHFGDGGIFDQIYKPAQ